MLDVQRSILLFAQSAALTMLALSGAVQADFIFCDRFESDACEPPPLATLRGLVLDETGARLPGVRVFDTGGDEIAVTGVDGFFQADIPVGSPLVLTLRKPGLANQFLRVSIPQGVDEWPAQTQMVRRGEPVTLPNAADGGEVEGQLGTRIDFPGDALVDSDGNPVTGDVTVWMTPVVTRGNSLGAFPGSFEATRSADDTGRLSTYGVVEVELEQNGERIRLAEGATAEIDIPMATQAEIGEEIALWSLQEDSAIWLEEGRGVVVEAPDAPAGVALRADVTHFSWWNVDIFSSAGQIILNFPYPDGAPANPPESFNAVGGTPEEFDGPMSQSSLRRITIGDNAAIPVPLGQPFRIEVTSIDGRYACSVTQTFEQDEEVDCPLVARVPETGEDLVEIAYGETKTLNLPTDDAQVDLVFDGNGGDYARLIVAATDDHATGLAIPRSIFGTRLATRTWQPDDRARVIYLVPDSGRNVIELQAVVAGEIEVQLDKLSGPTLQMEQSQSVTLEPDQAYEWVFWGNVGQVVHAYAYGETRPSLRWELELDGEELSGERANYGGNSKIFELPASGLYLLRLDTIGSFLTENIDHNVSLTEIAPAQPVVTKNGASHFERISYVPGKVHRFRAPMQAEDVIFARPTRTEAADPQPNMIAESITRPQVVESSDEELGSYLVYRVGLPIDTTIDVFRKGDGTGPYTMEIERMGLRNRVVVGPEDADPNNCAADTSNLNVAAFAVDHDGVVEVCPGLYQTYGGLGFLRENTSLEGASSAEVSLMSWPDEPIVQPGGLASLQGVTLAPGANSFSGSARVILNQSLAGAPLRLSDILVLAAQQGAPQTLIEMIGAEAEQFEADDILIEDLELLGPAKTGISLIGADGARLERISMRSAVETGIAAWGVEDLVVRDYTVTDVEQGIDGRNIFGALVDNAEIELSDNDAPERFGIRLDSDFRPQTLITKTLTVRNSSVIAGNEGDYGLLIIVGDSDVGALIEQNRLYGMALGDVGLQILENAGNTAGLVTVQNNEILSHREKGIEVLRVGNYDDIRIVNNTIRQEFDTGVQFDAVSLNVLPGDTSGALRIYNNIFAGYDPVDDRGVYFTRNSSFEADYNLFSLVGTLYAQGSDSLQPGLNDMPSTKDGTQPNPMFIGPNSGAVEAASPAVDAGTDIYTPDVDINGVPRPTGTAIDIGAYER